MTIQFNHKRNIDNKNSIAQWIVDPRGGETIALEVIEPWVFDAIAVNDFFERKVGVARCSTEDNYCKKIGRELSTQRMKTIRLVVTATMGNETETIIHLVDKDNNTYVLKKVNGQKVHFVGYNE